MPQVDNHEILTLISVHGISSCKVVPITLLALYADVVFFLKVFFYSLIPEPYDSNG